MSFAVFDPMPLTLRINFVILNLCGVITGRVFTTKFITAKQVKRCFDVVAVF